MSRRLKIYVDLAASPEALDSLRTGVGSHELLFSRTPVSVVSAAGSDPALKQADVAFGQPHLEAIAEARSLRWIQLSSSGFARYDTPAFRSFAASREMAVCSSASVYANACAIHALGFLLAQARQFPVALQSRIENGSVQWDALRERCGTLCGESLLILGYGAIGARLIELLRPFDMRITAFRRRPRGDEPVPLVTLEALPAALAQADHVLNILPGTDETRCFFNHSKFASMKKGSTFYNIGRGTSVDQEALRECLQSGHLRAAWLDVTEPEPLPADHPLRALQNCHITPHIAGGHAGEGAALVQHFLQNLERFLAGAPLIDRVM